MRIVPFDGSGDVSGFFKSKYAAFGAEGQTSVIPSNTTVLSVTGEGYLDLATVDAYPSPVSIYIIVDGVTKTYTSADRTAGFCGDFKYIYADGFSTSSSQLLVLSGGGGHLFRSKPVDNSEFLSLDQPIFFNSSLVVKITGPLTNTSYSVRGGLLT